jgi:sterol desaturase/sphingolipid hydroxylase (fatty acid hydroxylase superfamily)
VLAVLFGTATTLITEWATIRSWGLLNHLGIPGWLHMLLAIVLLDGWMYLWHRANHALPVLWRFHRLHHSDTHMDVTTATRFHLGEHLVAAAFRLGLIPVLGIRLWDVALYDLLLIALTQFHHADISIGRLDRPLRWLIVTPAMHQVHHSRRQVETDSNFTTLLSLWDRLGGTFRRLPEGATLEFGLDEWDSPRWQTLRGMLLMPFVSTPRKEPRDEPAVANAPAARPAGPHFLPLAGEHLTANEEQRAPGSASTISAADER